MFTKFRSIARAGLVVLTIVGGASASAAASPTGAVPNPVLDSGNLIRVQGDGRYSDCGRGGDCWRRDWRGGDRKWRRDRDWRRDRYWRGDRHWSRDRYWRRDRDRRGHRYHRRHHDGPGFRIYLD